MLHETGHLSQLSLGLFLLSEFTQGSTWWPWGQGLLTLPDRNSSISKLSDYGGLLLMTLEFIYFYGKNKISNCIF